MKSDKRWEVNDRYGNRIYLTEERWEHITEDINHPEMADNENELKETIRSGKRTQDIVNPQKYHYSMEFGNLSEYNTHIVAIVLFRFSDGIGEIIANNYIVTAYQKEIG